MIGELKQLGAVLNDDGVWETLPPTAKMLNTYYQPGSFGGVEVVFPFGHYAVMKAAADWKADYTLAHPGDPLPEGAIS